MSIPRLLEHPITEPPHGGVDVLLVHEDAQPVLVGAVGVDPDVGESAEDQALDGYDVTQALERTWPSDVGVGEEKFREPRRAAPTTADHEDGAVAENALTRW